jgi:hypothetical protein
MRQDELLCCGLFFEKIWVVSRDHFILVSSYVRGFIAWPRAARDRVDFRNGYALYHYTPQKDEGNGCQGKVSITCFRVDSSVAI